MNTTKDGMKQQAGLLRKALNRIGRTVRGSSAKSEFLGDRDNIARLTAMKKNENTKI